jgi:threonine-phosphate decarboxylase
VILEPTFSEYAPAAEAAGLEPTRRVARRPEDGFALDEQALDDLEGVAVVFLCNPNNPTGGVLGRGAVMEISGRVREAGAVLVVDEAFVDFVPEASVADAVDEHLLVARSFTKFFAIPGLRLGCLICPEPAPVQALQPSWPVNAVAAAAGTAAARDTGFAERSVHEVARLRAALAADLSALPGLTVYPGSANFLLLRGPEGLAEGLARRRVLVRGCAPFPGLGPGFFRVAVRGEGENRELVEAVGGAL